jgi:exopolysaccharide production protein ExoZ
MVSLSAESAVSGPAAATPAVRSPVGADLLSIQYLRAVAAIGVLIFHAADRTGGRFPMGGAGVDVFFVISGLIMWAIAARRPLRPGDFLLRRATRIVPLYWLATLALAGAWLLAPGLFPHMQPTAGHVIQSLLFIPHADPAGVVAPLVVPGWTLTYEVFFYLVFSGALALSLRWRAWGMSAALGLLVLAGVLLRPHSPILATYTSPLLLEFLAGLWIGKAWTDGASMPPAMATVLLVAGAALLGMVALSGVDVEPWRLLLWGGPAVLIVGGAMGLERAGKVPRWPAVKFLGDASYSIYLVHTLAVSVAVRLSTYLGLTRGPLVFIVAVAGGLVAGVICFLVVERPLLAVFQRPATARRRLAVP